MTNHKPKQRETLFSSEEEKRAQIERYQVEAAKYEKLESELSGQLFNVRAQREQIARRIQELQNLDIFEG